jgi:hypothetical protein
VQAIRKAGPIETLWVTAWCSKSNLAPLEANRILWNMLKTMQDEVGKLSVEGRCASWNVRTVFDAQKQEISLVTEILPESPVEEKTL